MAKKIYSAPYIKVVRVKNDIIATSFGDGRLGASVYSDGQTDTNTGYNENMF